MINGDIGSVIYIATEDKTLDYFKVFKSCLCQNFKKYEWKHIT